MIMCLKEFGRAECLWLHKTSFKLRKKHVLKIHIFLSHHATINRLLVSHVGIDLLADFENST